MKRIFRTAMLAILFMAASIHAQTLLYQWNFDNATGSGNGLVFAPSYINVSMTGGTLSNLNAVAGISAPSASGVYGSVVPTDLGLVDTNVYRSNGSIYGTQVGDLSSVSAFTVSLWFNLNASVTNFTTLNGGGFFSRLLVIGTNSTTGIAGVDGTELYLALNSTNLQFGVNKASTGTTTTTSQFGALGASPATMTNNWIFVAASYTTAGGGTVNLYTGTTNIAATLTSTITGVGTIAWSATTNIILIGNQGAGTRNLPGTIDDVNIYSGAQTLAQIQAVQTNAAPNTNSPFAGAPLISPANVIYLGSSITLTDSPTGLAPFFYQWQTDSGNSASLTAVPNETNSSFTTTPPNTGTFEYNVIVTNSYGSSTSSVATVIVLAIPGTANVTVNVSSNLSTVAGTAYGMGTAIYDNQNGNAALPNLLIQSGVNTLRYPGGGLADVFHWSVERSPAGNDDGRGVSPWFGITNDYSYVGSKTDFGNFVKLLTNSQCQAVITINYGSGQQWGSSGHTNLVVPGTNAEPPEAAAWVAYANANTNIFGTANDIALGTDSLGNNWQTAGYWAMMRAASPLGTDDGYNFLRIGRKQPVGIKYWEIGNEQFGTGYGSTTGTGYSVCYAVPYPYTTYPRYGNPSLSPEFYGQKVKQFSMLMKAVDPTIKIGAVGVNNSSSFYYTFNGPGVYWTPEVLAQCATNIDFLINHSYPYAGNYSDGTSMLSANNSYLQSMINGTGNHTGQNEGLRDMINAVRPDGTNVQIFITEFAYTGTVTNSLNGEPIYGPVNALLAADSYATWMDLGVSNMDWLELNKNTFLGDSNPLLPGSAYYAIQLTHAMAAPGDTLVSSTSDVGALRTHAAVQQSGKIGVMLLNENLTNSLNVNVTIPNVNLASSATMYQFGTNNFTNGNSITPATGPTTNTFSILGNTFSVALPPYTMAVLTIATNAPPANTPPVLAAISNQTVNVGQTVAFTANVTDTDQPPQTLTFTLLAGTSNSTLNTKSGAFSWRPITTQANSTNAFSLKVADNGTPSLSATQNFFVTVNPLMPPQFTNFSAANGKFNFQVNGMSGPDYEVQSSTNLTQWSAAFITNSPAMPFIWTDSDTTNVPARFYRVVVGPPLP